MNLQTQLVELPGVAALCLFAEDIITLEVSSNYVSFKRLPTDEETLARAREAIEIAKRYERKNGWIKREIKHE